MSRSVTHPVTLVHAAETMAKSNPSLWKTMTNWLKDFVTSFARRVKRAFSGITATSEEAQALTEIRDGVERYVGNMLKLWDNALVRLRGIRWTLRRRRGRMRPGRECSIP